MNTSLRVALVVQRYGPEVAGGAETAARWIAEKLATRLEVDVLTTCALDYTTWANHYLPGRSRHKGVTIHRFAVDHTRDWGRSLRETGRFMQRERTLAEEATWVRQEGPFSTALLQYIKRHAADYEAFIFFTYLYATTCFGLPLVADKAILVPTAHDEPFLYMEIFRRLCHLPRSLIYLTVAEQMLVQRITGNISRPHEVIAVGLDRPDDVSAERFRHQHNLHEPFLLYGGRISAAKNVPELLAFFTRYREETRRPLKLVLMGRAHMELASHPDILAVGYVSEQEKYDAIQAATLVVLPSIYESLSIIILEAWLLGIPVLVNGRCAVTKQQCRLSNGGLYYVSYREFAATLSRLLDNPLLRRKLGTQGHRFVRERYHWPEILTRYENMINRLSA
jgi:glycosyltransferase involved in cell wall biosynthesis